MKKFREWIVRWLEGRYGCDGLSVLYLCLAVMIAVCAHGHMSGVTQTFWYIAACVLAAYAIYRCFSRDAAKQQRQWDAVEHEIGMLEYKISLRIGTWKIRNGYRYLRCRQCGRRYRVRKKKGKHTAECPNCGYQRTIKK